MANRLELHREFEYILGNKNVYYQPPENLKLHYPCIRYSVSSIRTMFADGKPYLYAKKYSLTYIHREPDTDIELKLLARPRTVFDRRYVADGLYHDVFTIGEMMEESING